MCWSVLRYSCALEACIWTIACLLVTEFFCCCCFCGILVPWPGIDPAPSAMKARSPNHRTTREFPWWLIVYVLYAPNRSQNAPLKNDLSERPELVFLQCWWGLLVERVPSLPCGSLRHMRPILPLLGPRCTAQGLHLKYWASSVASVVTSALWST